MLDAGPAGVALLVQGLEDHTIQLLQTQISPGETLPPACSRCQTQEDVLLRSEACQGTSRGRCTVLRCLTLTGITEARERMHKLGIATGSRSMPSAQAGHHFCEQALAKVGSQAYRITFRLNQEPEESVGCLSQALGGDLQRELMLRQLSELGNAFALLCLLDEVVAAQQDSAFLLAAPLLGDAAVPGTRLSQQVSYAPQRSPTQTCSWQLS